MANLIPSIAAAKGISLAKCKEIHFFLVCAQRLKQIFCIFSTLFCLRFCQKLPFESKFSMVFKRHQVVTERVNFFTVVCTDLGFLYTIKYRFGSDFCVR
ncbi:hypothetical protein FKM82_003637 [Ascaphus truei]